MNVSKIEKIKQILDPNDIKYSGIISQMYTQTKNGKDFIFVKLPVDMSADDRDKLLQWYTFFGNKKYKYSLSEYSIIGKLIVR